MHLILTDAGSESFLLQELKRTFRHGRHAVYGPRLVESDFVLQPDTPPILVFARQFFPEADEQTADSIAAWGECLFGALVSGLPERPWRVHVGPQYGSNRTGEHRCRLIRQAALDLLKRKRRHLLRLNEDSLSPFEPDTSLVQLLLVAPDRGFLSIACAPWPFQLRALIAPFPKGEVPVARDPSPPSRAFAKLFEAEQRLGHRIARDETCIDLGAAPGSWTYVAVQRGARVIAVDRSPLREDLMREPRVRFVRGDAFRFHPDAPVDWLLCDVIAAPERSIDLLINWARERRMRRFVVTIKFQGQGDYDQLERLKHALPPLCADFYLTRLCANKNEACAFGELTQQASGTMTVHVDPQWREKFPSVIEQPAVGPDAQAADRGLATDRSRVRRVTGRIAGGHSRR